MSTPLALSRRTSSTHVDTSSIRSDNSISSKKDSTVGGASSSSINTSKDASKSSPPPPAKRSLPWYLWWNAEDWWSCWIGLLIFGAVALIVPRGVAQPHFLPWSVNPFDTFADPGNWGLIVLFPAMGALVWLACASTLATAWRLYPLGYLVIFSLAFVSKWLAANKSLHNISLGDSVWAIVFGTLLRNFLSFKKTHHRSPLPPWLKVAQQTELYIAISLVLLCIDMSVLRPLAPRAVFVSWLDTPTMFISIAFVGYKYLKIDLHNAIIMSGATFICGSSAAVALAASIGAPAKAEMPIAIISVFTIPSLLALPYIAKSIQISPKVAGAWFGGSVDSTGAVIAAASIYGDKDAINTAAVVKMMQNVLIGPLSVFVAYVWSHREISEAKKNEDRLIEMAAQDNAFAAGDAKEAEDMEAKKESAYVLLWKRFPKFVIGFILTAVFFNTLIPDADRTNVNEFCFTIGEWFSTMSFVNIGMGLQFFELRRDIVVVGKLCTLYLIAQLVDVVATGGLAWIAFDLF
ncbi:hypothetical protein BC938DRAFT_479577 [Jimgerdemannia flammicorona]|uniref:Uncharacterized protein n=1 Tax=Jimgerdemannia flammicorona TaxID=994334 RepID=A0A433QKL3_9FUNG|nr:hypothetical protein BC938DRAFT_479577 [Jimgerdemannia flammicorona]